MNTISIAIPVYNQAGTIGETIEAALAQADPAGEIVISENHSTDGTREIVESYSGRVRVIRPPCHYNGSDNLNFCIRACKSDWVAICSGDDILLPNYISDVSAAIRKYPDAVFVMGGWENLDDSTGKITPHYLLSMGEITRPPKSLEIQLLGPKACFAAYCFKRGIYEKVGGFNRAFWCQQDWMLQFDLAKYGAFVKVDKLIARYRAQIRPDEEKRRIPMFFNDKILYLSDKIWEALDYGVSPAKAKRAAKLYFFHFLNYIDAKQVKLDESSETRIRSIATKVGLLKEFECWRAGKWRPPGTGLIDTHVKPVARKIHQLFH